MVWVVWYFSFCDRFNFHFRIFPFLIYWRNIPEFRYCHSNAFSVSLCTFSYHLGWIFWDYVFNCHSLITQKMLFLFRHDILKGSTQIRTRVKNMGSDMRVRAPRLQSCWWQCYVGDFIMAIVLWCWWQNYYVGDFFCHVGDFFNVKKIGHQHLKSITKISKLSPTETVTIIEILGNCFHQVGFSSVYWSDA